MDLQREGAELREMRVEIGPEVDSGTGARRAQGHATPRPAPRGRGGRRLLRLGGAGLGRTPTRAARARRRRIPGALGRDRRAPRRRHGALFPAGRRARWPTRPTSCPVASAWTPRTWRPSGRTWLRACPCTSTDGPRHASPSRMVRFFGHGGGVAFYLIGGMFALTAASSALFAHTAGLRLHRDVGRMVLEDNTDILDGVQWSVAATADAAAAGGTGGGHAPPTSRTSWSARASGASGTRRATTCSSPPRWPRGAARPW